GLRSRDGRFIQRRNGSHDGFAQAWFGQEVRFARAGAQRLQELRIIEEAEQRLCGLTDLLQVGNEGSVAFLVGVLLAKLTVTDDQIEKRPAVALQGLQV